MGFEPTTTGTTIRGSTAELRPPSWVGTVYRRWLRIASLILIFLLIICEGEVGGDGSAAFLMYCMDEEKMEIKKAEKM